MEDNVVWFSWGWKQKFLNPRSLELSAGFYSGLFQTFSNVFVARY